MIAKYFVLHLEFIFPGDVSGSPEAFDETSLQHQNYLYIVKCKFFTLKNDLKNMSDYRNNSLPKN